MEVILLERVENLGQMGDVVKVKDGFARNFLLPRRKALRATKANVEQFKTQRAQLEATNLTKRKDAEAVGAKLAGFKLVVLRQASEGGQLYGSVNARDVAVGLTEKGFTADKRQVQLMGAIKNVGLHKVRIALHPEVIVDIELNVARTEAEAEAQAAGKVITTALPTAAEEAQLEAFFEDAELAERAKGTPAEGEGATKAE
ncbi:MAG: 50S ribosomal protein L9 [Alphaproteobacteria bacterium]|nr:50S ribosomal protein L9 [Alphaproteobacteria bacterium]